MIGLIRYAMIGLAATTASAPAENVKTVMQVQSRLTFSDTCRQIYKQGGAKAFFRGWTPLYLKIAPHTAILFVSLEQIRWRMGIASH